MFPWDIIVFSWFLVYLRHLSAVSLLHFFSIMPCPLSLFFPSRLSISITHRLIHPQKIIFQANHCKCSDVFGSRNRGMATCFSECLHFSDKLNMWMKLFARITNIDIIYEANLSARTPVNDFSMFSCTSWSYTDKLKVTWHKMFPARNECWFHHRWRRVSYHI